MIELMVALTLSLIAMGVVAQIIVTGNKTYTQENVRIERNDTTRTAFNALVRTVRDSACVIVTDDLDQDGTAEGTVLGVNFALDDPDTGKAAVRDGLLYFTDSEQQTIYFDTDDSGTAGFGFPDVVGFDDADGDGKSDVMGIALIPQVSRITGEWEVSMSQEELRAASFPDWPKGVPIPTFMIDPIPSSDGFSPIYWKIVSVRFNNLSEVNSLAKWRSGRTLMTYIRPYVTNPKSSTENLDTIAYEGLRAESYDYGHDYTFGTGDTGEGDGIVDEFEIGSAGDGSHDNFIDTAGEIRLIGAIRFNLNTRKRINARRNDDYSAGTAVTPRAFTMVEVYNLKFPVPQT